MFRLMLAGLLALIAAPAFAQTGTLSATRIFFDAGPQQRAGSGDPEGSVEAPAWFDLFPINRRGVHQGQRVWKYRLVSHLGRD